MEESKKTKIAVYGSLRKGLPNHDILERNKAKFIGEFISDPYFTLYSLGAFPGLQGHGQTPVVMEVYEVDYQGLVSVDALENYTPGSKFNNFYTREKIHTPYGEAYTYFYVPNANKLDVVESGNWTEFFKEKQQLKKIKENANALQTSN